jgi:hypothetical protein
MSSDHQRCLEELQYQLDQEIAARVTATIYLICASGSGLALQAAIINKNTDNRR